MMQTDKTKSHIGGRIWRYGPVVLWLAFIFFASTDNFSASKTSRFIGPLLHWLLPSWDAASIKWLHGLIRKAGHFSEYALLALLAARALTTSARAWLRDYWFAWAASLIIIYALLDEYHQSFVATRTSSIYDSLIDMAGGLTLLIIFWLWRKRRTEPVLS